MVERRYALSVVLSPIVPALPCLCTPFRLHSLLYISWCWVVCFRWFRIWYDLLMWSIYSSLFLVLTRHSLTHQFKWSDWRRRKGDCSSSKSSRQVKGNFLKHRPTGRNLSLIFHKRPQLYLTTSLLFPQKTARLKWWQCGNILKHLDPSVV